METTWYSRVRAARIKRWSMYHVRIFTKKFYDSEVLSLGEKTMSNNQCLLPLCCIIRIHAVNSWRDIFRSDVRWHLPVWIKISVITHPHLSASVTYLPDFRQPDMFSLQHLEWQINLLDLMSFMEIFVIVLFL